MKIKHSFPTNEEFNSLFSSVGWGIREDKKIDLHRLCSSYCVSVYIDEKICGMARVVGDGSYYTVYDVVVKKEYQCKGIGSLIMKDIVEWFENLNDDDTYLYLGASLNKESFYEKFGFKSRPFGNIGAGMKYVGKDNT